MAWLRAGNSRDEVLGRGIGGIPQRTKVQRRAAVNSDEYHKGVFHVRQKWSHRDSTQIFLDLVAKFSRSPRAVVASAMCAHAIRAAALVLALCPARCAPDLEHLAFHFGTDKSHDDHKYTDLYAMLFAPLRNTAQNITEIGIAAGQSLWLWNDYFPQAHIWGIDIAPNQLRQQRPAFTANAPRVHLLLGDVTNPSEVESFGFSPESMDVIIDDGPHSSGPNERILVNMWPYLKPGGYYCVEDIQTGIDDMAATQSTASGAGVPGKPGWAYLAHGAAEGRMGEQARHILQEHSAGPTLSLNP